MDVLNTTITPNWNDFTIKVQTSEWIFTAVCSEFEFGSFANLFREGLPEEIAKTIFKPGSKYFDGGCGENANWFWLVADRQYGTYFGCDISTVFDKYQGRFPNRTLASKTDILSWLLAQPDLGVDVMMFFGMDNTIFKSWMPYVSKIAEVIPTKLAPNWHIIAQNSSLLLQEFVDNGQFKVIDKYGEPATEINDYVGFVFQKK